MEKKKQQLNFTVTEIAVVKEESGDIFLTCCTLWCLQWDLIALSYQAYC